MIKNLHEIAEQETSRRLQLFQNTFSDAVCSIYALRDNHDCPHLGSGTFVNWESRVFLITALHLLESGKNALGIMAQTNKCSQPVLLMRRFIESDKEQDLALCEIIPEEVDTLRVKPIDAKYFFLVPAPADGLILATIGWPNTKNELNRYSNKRGQQMMVSGPQKVAASAGFDESLDEAFVYQKFRKQDAIDVNQQRINSPKLVGLSGGLTFDLGNPIDPKVLKGKKEIDPHPIGICTKTLPLNRVIRSTRPGKFIRTVLNSGINLLS